MAVGVSGLSSDIDTQDIINKLIEVEKRPLARMEEEKEILNFKVEVLQELNKNLARLKDSSYRLYGLESVFRSKKAFGVNEDFYSIIANPNALPGNFRLQIDQLAASHSVASDPFPSSTQFKKGTISIRIGTNEKEILFDGGDADQLVWAINRQAGNIIDAGTVRNTSDTSVLSLTAKDTGKRNSIVLKDPEGILSSISMLKKKKESSFELDLSGNTSPDFQKYKGVKDSLKNLEGSLNINAGNMVVDDYAAELTIPVTKADVQTVLQVRWIHRKKTAPTTQNQVPEENLDSATLFSRIFSVQVKELEIRGAPFAINPQEKDTGEPEDKTATIQREKESGVGIASVSGKKRVEKLFPLQTSSNEQSVEIPLDKGFDSFNTVIVYSDDPESELVITHLQIADKSKGGMDFAKTLQQPQDARFKINDVDVERPRNDNIDDVINNISINLKQTTDKPTSFNVDFDKEKIENGITSFISNYNRCVSMMMDVQKSKEVTKPGEYERSDRGILAGDITINNIRSRMRSIMVAPYPTSLSNRLALAMQMGISTGRFNAPVDEVRAGLLKFDQELFRKMFTQYPQATAELFGSDTDGNKIIDSGLGFVMNDFLLNVTRPKSGMVNLMVEKTKTDIDSKKKQIKTKEEQIAAYEEKLKIQFLNMEKNMSGLKAQQKWMDQQMKNQNKD